MIFFLYNIMEFFYYIIISIFFILYLNYNKGKQFKNCNSCPANKIRYIKYSLPPSNIIFKLENIIRKLGDSLNPKLNLSNAKGKKLDYISIKKKIPEIIDFYMTNELLEKANKTLNKKLNFAPESERYRIFVRLYENENDFLNWHYDNNFTSGKRYTIILPLIIDDCNTSEFQIKDRKDSTIKEFKTKLGEGVIYNGTNVYHRITKQNKYCRRLVVIIPLYENYNISFLGNTRKLIRDITDKTITI